jgi:EpsI family protein
MRTHMSATNPDRIRAAVPLFLAVQVLIVHAATSSERPPWPPDPDRFPAAFGAWELLRNDPVDPAIAKELGADRLVSQTYLELPGASWASLLMAWFQTQREGARQPHSPKVCLPGAGWTPRVSDEITFDTPAGPLDVNRYVVTKGVERAVILYWYQTPRRVVAGEWAAKFWLVADALRDKRTDTALVRIVVSSAAPGDDAATSVAIRFARNVYPALRQYLPH